MRSSNLDVSFDAAIDSGEGADGLTLVFADPTKGATATSLGLSGGGLGWSTIPGVAVALDTYQNGTDPSSNFVGVATGHDAGNPDNLTWKVTNTNVPDLRSAARHVRVLLQGGTLTVWINGTQVLLLRRPSPCRRRRCSGLPPAVAV